VRADAAIAEDSKGAQSLMSSIKAVTDKYPHDSNMDDNRVRKLNEAADDARRDVKAAKRPTYNAGADRFAQHFISAGIGWSEDKNEDIWVCMAYP